METVMDIDVDDMNSEERRREAVRLRSLPGKRKGTRKTFEEIGEVLGVSRQRVHQMTKEKKPSFRDNGQMYVRDFSLSLASALFSIERAKHVWYIRTTTGCQLGPYSTKKRAEEMLPLLAKAYAVFASRTSTDLECAIMIRDLMSAKLTQTEIADVFSKRETWISFIRKLNALPESLLDYLRRDVVKTTTVLKATHKFGAAVTERAIKDILTTRSGKVTHRELSDLARLLRG